jgi:hypothetical protein
MRILKAWCSLGVAVMWLLSASPLVAQTETASLSGRVTDPQGAIVPHTVVEAIENNTNVKTTTGTNDAGLYYLRSLHPGTYRVIVSKDGFKQVIQADVVLHVQDVLTLNFGLQLGSVNETVTVTGGTPLVDTTDATVSTVVDRNFAENLPMNGRSFQTLIQLTPGVVITTSTNNDEGQFSVNGQRATSNYWMVDGVSANVGISPYPSGNGVGGTIGSFSALGGTNSLVSVDALQEFRIQTSTYAPEFGRTPGAQISIVTRSGANQFHGTIFDYFRNDVLDANDWFADRNKLAKPEERQNDFGGTLGGPILKDKTFFFFSYEGLRLRLPQVAQATVPDVTARQSAIPAVQPFLNAYPLPNGPEDPANPGAAQFNASFSNSARLDAHSLRIDHRFNDKLNLFGRYNYSPSQITQRGLGGSDALSVLVPVRITTQTATVGSTWVLSRTVTNDLRINYSRTNGHSFATLDNFGGAVPLASLPFPSPFTSSNATFSFEPFSLSSGLLAKGENQRNLLQQLNIIENFTVQRGEHSLKFGVDFRRLSTLYAPPVYTQSAFFLDIPSAEAGNLFLGEPTSFRAPTLLFHNIGVFAQDTWRISSRLTMTYGIRWDVDVAPSSNPSLLGVTGFNLNDLSGLALAPVGTPPFKTTYGNVAPRIGIAYQLARSQNWQTVIRGGFGVYFDLASSEVGNLIGEAGYPFSAFNLVFGGAFPLDSAPAAPPPITLASLSSNTLSAFDPSLQLPYTLQWNVALEQGLGGQQMITASYVGSAGRRLIQSAFVTAPNPNFGFANLVANSATSDYGALQLQFQRRLSRGLQALASYTWSHSIDTASAGSPFGNEANAAVPGVNPNANRGPSDFDIRNAFSAGVTYDVPAPKFNAFTNAILQGWSLENVLLARSAPPVDLYDGGLSTLFGGFTRVRPDVVSGIPLYLYGSQYPGGKIFNNTPNQGGPGCVGPFCPPPTNSSGQSLRQGDLSRNALRGFGATQWDFAVHRNFPIHESLKLQFRAEMFNVLNHPNFGQPVSDINNTQFGQSIQMLGRSLSGNNSGGGAFNPLYQIGGPRSIQFALKLIF